MNVFVDTNVILENLLMREESKIVHQLFQKFQQQECQLYMSVGSFYTMIFLVDKYLRKEVGLIGESRVMALRLIMSDLLQTVRVAEHDNNSLLNAVNDKRFRDMEDSCQYELAQKCGCSFLLTFNISDFSVGNDYPVRVLTPGQYLNLYSNK